jgi:hypothetical protein
MKADFKILLGARFMEHFGTTHPNDLAKRTENHRLEFDVIEFNLNENFSCF